MTKKDKKVKEVKIIDESKFATINKEEYATIQKYADMIKNVKTNIAMDAKGAVFISELDMILSDSSVDTVDKQKILYMLDELFSIHESIFDAAVLSNSTNGSSGPLN